MVEGTQGFTAAGSWWWVSTVSGLSSPAVFTSDMGIGVLPGVPTASMLSLRTGAGVQVGVPAMLASCSPAVLPGVSVVRGPVLFSFAGVAESGSGVSRACEPVAAKLQPHQRCNLSMHVYVAALQFSQGTFLRIRGHL